jgi:hypothetical protein
MVATVTAGPSDASRITPEAAATLVVDVVVPGGVSGPRLVVK